MRHITRRISEYDKKFTICCKRFTENLLSREPRARCNCRKSDETRSLHLHTNLHTPVYLRRLIDAKQSSRYSARITTAASACNSQQARNVISRGFAPTKTETYELEMCFPHTLEVDRFLYRGGSAEIFQQYGLSARGLKCNGKLNCCRAQR